MSKGFIPSSLPGARLVSTQPGWSVDMCGCMMKMPHAASVLLQRLHRWLHSEPHDPLPWQLLARLCMQEATAWQTQPDFSRAVSILRAAVKISKSDVLEQASLECCLSEACIHLSRCKVAPRNPLLYTVTARDRDIHSGCPHSCHARILRNQDNFVMP